MTRTPVASLRCAFPLAGGDICGPAEPSPRCPSDIRCSPHQTPRFLKYVRGVSLRCAYPLAVGDICVGRAVSALSLAFALDKLLVTWAVITPQ
jgi:hypothetical protein